MVIVKGVMLNVFLSNEPSRTQHLPFTIYRLPFTVYRLLITDYRIPLTDYWLPLTDYCLLFTAYRLPLTALLLTAYRLPITAYCLLFTDYRLPFNKERFLRMIEDHFLTISILSIVGPSISRISNSKLTQLIFSDCFGIRPSTCMIRPPTVLTS